MAPNLRGQCRRHAARALDGQPVKLEEGQRVQVYLHYEVGLEKEADAETKLRQTQELFAGLSEKETTELESIRPAS